MARMIPPYVHPDTPSSERKVFERISLDPDTDGWVVLHSLGLSRRKNRVFGEIDFVVLVPGGGVVCLEVKGGRIRCENGIWYTRDRHGREHALPRSPFQQVREAMFGLRDAIKRRFGSLAGPSRLLYAAAVVFPDIEAPPSMVEFERWEVIDAADMRGPISAAIRRVLREEGRRTGKDRQGNLADHQVLRELRNYLRPDFDAAVARLTTIRHSEERIIRLTEEQYDIIDLFEDNPRCLVEGAAGTGKTMLAVEFARRMANAGARVHLLCYNRLLGDWLSRRIQELGSDRITAGSFHREIRTVIRESPYAEEFAEVERIAQEAGRLDELFQTAYPLYGQLAIAELDSRTDILILDEAQDLIGPAILDVLNDWVVGGLAGGRWVMLGDFSRQALYGSDLRFESARDLLADYAPYFTTASLRRNCRNTRRIGEETALVSGFKSLPYRLDAEDCLPVDYRYWGDRDHQRRRLDEVLRSLRDEGIPSEDVVILSPRRFESSVASEVTTVKVAPIEGLNEAGEEIRFSTIHGFKGLESPVVILCDIESIDDEKDRALLYVGMSRARSHLIVLLQEGLQAAVAMAIERKLREGWKA